LRFIRLLVTFGISFVLILPAFAISIGHDTAKEPIPFLENIRIVEDTGHVFGAFEPALESALQNAKPQSSNIGYTKSVWWAHFTLENPFPTEQTRYLEFADSGEGMPDIRFFIKNAAGHVTTVHSGGMHRYQGTELEHRFIVVPLKFGAHETLTVQVRAKGDSIHFPFHLHGETSFLSSNYNELTWIGFSYGILVLMLLYNITLFAVSKDKSYAYYVGFIFFLTLAISAFDGTTAQYLLRHHPFLGTRLVNISASLCSLFLLLFSVEFLRIKEHKPSLMRVATGLGVFTAFLALANLGHKLNAGTNLAVTMVSLFCLWLAQVSYRFEKQLALSYLFPIVFFLAGNFATSLRIVGFIEANFWTVNSLRFGMILNAAFWSLALSYRIRVLMQEEFALQKKLLQKIRDVEAQKAAQLSKRVELVKSISERLDNPLDSLLGNVGFLHEQAKALSEAPQSPLPPDTPLANFVKEWQRQHVVLSAAITRLTSLSESLAQFHMGHQKLTTKSVESKP
jgi:signal transduction histidine kinase